MLRAVSISALLLSLLASGSDAAWWHHYNHNVCPRRLVDCDDRHTERQSCERWRRWKCSWEICDWVDTEDRNGVCHCNPGYAGRLCNECADGHDGFPNCVSLATQREREAAAEQQRQREAAAKQQREREAAA